MKDMLSKLGYSLYPNRVWSRSGYGGISYSDGDEVEERIASIVAEAKDVSVLSTELCQHCTDWPSLYHLSSSRANIIRPFEETLAGADVLEIGAGCGAITRYLGESGARVLALEGSYRRAAITRSRTRDLSNVEVVSDNFDQFVWNNKFDVITLIGVLEYANLFMRGGEQPALKMLRSVRAMLNKPHGRLLLAIENQLGLKYFAGAPEDHIGQPMYGIEGHYQANQPQTYGRKVLANLLQQANFANSEFLFPFPDYKFPRSIVTEKGFFCKEFDAGALVWQADQYDPQRPTYPLFSLELTWPSIIKNQMAMDLANSFLIVANADDEIKNSENLAYHYSNRRRREFCKETTFMSTESGAIKVQYRMLLPDMPKHSKGDTIEFSIEETDKYVLGSSFCLGFIRILGRNGWCIEDVAVFFKRYLSILSSLAFVDDPEKIISVNTLLPGKFFDAIPSNIIIKNDDTEHLIDKEWILIKPISIGYLIFRALLNLFCNRTPLGQTDRVFEKKHRGLFQEIYKTIGFEVNTVIFDAYWDQEIRIQAEINGSSIVNSDVNPFPDTPLVFNTIHNSKQIANLNQTLAEHYGQIAKLNQTLAERDEQIANLKQVVSSKKNIENELISIHSSKTWKLINFIKRVFRYKINE